MDLKVNVYEDPRRVEYWENKTIRIGKEGFISLLEEWDEDEDYEDMRWKNLIGEVRKLVADIQGNIAITILQMETGMPFIDEAYMYIRVGNYEPDFGIALMYASFGFPPKRRYEDLYADIQVRISEYLKKNPRLKHKEGIIDYFEGMNPLFSRIEDEDDDEEDDTWSEPTNTPWIPIPKAYNEREEDLYADGSLSFKIVVQSKNLDEVFIETQGLNKLEAIGLLQIALNKLIHDNYESQS